MGSNRFNNLLPIFFNEQVECIGVGITKFRLFCYTIFTNMNPYNHKNIEQKWQKDWEEKGIYKTSDDLHLPKKYILDMFPYPSGEGLHVGHPRGYIATDIYSRMKRMEGFNVLHPMGWDAFGLPAENFAIKNKVHPRVAVEKNVARFKEQLAIIGLDHDWSREINTTDPAFYKWTQWIFLQMFKKGLAYESYEPINWCPSCQTGLANEDVEADGTCERCGTVVEKKPMRQWVLKITDYADRLLADLDQLPKWPVGVKEAQRNWIGRSEGSEIEFKTTINRNIKIFTTRADTLFGVTYVVLSPEHQDIGEFIVQAKNMVEVSEYVRQAKERLLNDPFNSRKEKTGIKLEGIQAINPVNGEEVPVWIADYVLAGYGTGAVMAVPAHDERDWEFAKKYELPIKKVNDGIAIEVLGDPKEQPRLIVLTDEIFIQKNKVGSYSARKNNDKWIHSFVFKNNDSKVEFFELIRRMEFKYQEAPYIEQFEDVVLINSGEYSELKIEKAKWEITEAVGGKMVTTYKIKDWVFSRQRYWGEPMPIIHCEKCGAVGVPEEQLPVLLPEVDSYEPTGTGESPLANIAEWVNTVCPTCGSPAKRETNTMPQWAGSSWYYLRYIDPTNNTALVDKEKEKTFMPVDVYVGGDHATRHLIYARFWHKFLFDIGAVSTEEPFPRLEFLGFILAEDGRKMSKRWKNVINPDDVINTFGADAFRLYEMFIGPFENTVRFNNDGMVGTYRFLERVWRLKERISDGAISADKIIHKTIKKVSDDIENFKFNTAVSSMMICLNELETQEKISSTDYKFFLQLLSPFAPHMTEELWHELGDSSTGSEQALQSIHLSVWPKYDESLTQDDEITVVVQINGKVRAELLVPVDIEEAEVIKLATTNEKILPWIDGKEIKKTIYVKGKLVSIVL